MMFYEKIIELPIIIMVLILTYYSDGKNGHLHIMNLIQSKKNINLRSCPATNFFLSRDDTNMKSIRENSFFCNFFCIMKKKWTVVNCQICSMSLSFVSMALVFLIFPGIYLRYK